MLVYVVPGSRLSSMQSAYGFGNLKTRMLDKAIDVEIPGIILTLLCSDGTVFLSSTAIFQPLDPESLKSSVKGLSPRT